ncbi:MAG: shikimate kinase [Candidatus Marinimicrobia bacterium]|nr:shikimate kinase [Candidatus Neomarinimicrobiota bacterium]
MKIFLIGMMGSGKSSVGEKLSEYIDIPFFDTDNILVGNEGISIKEIFKKKGEKYFRQIESESLKKIRGDGVISCGGGSILAKENRNYFKNKGYTIYLKSSLSTLKKRISNDINKDRPIIDYKNIKKSLKAVYEKRKLLFLESANDTIITDNKSLDDICKTIIKNIKIEKV